jgi:hypothetical protein
VELTRILLQGTTEAQASVRNNLSNRKTGNQVHTSASKCEGRRGSLSPAVAFAAESPLASPIALVHPESAKATFQIESPFSLGAMRRAKSAPPRSDHTQNARGMHFANEAPGTAFRHPSPRKTRSSHRMLPTKFWEKSELPSSSLVRDTAQNIRAWLHQQAEDTALREFDSGVEFCKREEQPSSPKLLSARLFLLSAALKRRR